MQSEIEKIKHGPERPKAPALDATAKRDMINSLLAEHKFRFPVGTILRDPARPNSARIYVVDGIRIPPRFSKREALCQLVRHSQDLDRFGVRRKKLVTMTAQELDRLVVVELPPTAKPQEPAA